MHVVFLVCCALSTAGANDHAQRKTITEERSQHSAGRQRARRTTSGKQNKHRQARMKTRAHAIEHEHSRRADFKSTHRDFGSNVALRSSTTRRWHRLCGAWPCPAALTPGEEGSSRGYNTTLLGKQQNAVHTTTPGEEWRFPHPRQKMSFSSARLPQSGQNMIRDLCFVFLNEKNVIETQRVRRVVLPCSELLSSEC
jgi:hypothetical protein